MYMAQSDPLFDGFVVTVDNVIANIPSAYVYLVVRPAGRSRRTNNVKLLDRICPSTAEAQWWLRVQAFCCRK
ncbi:hypothetical protein BO71DRAFT_399036 [Aspergillus ellipticus CBS 707.79]|uniref:Uncharacterized protein n=1 Tax=Aspergillus ellipticus CBS 707.79 TaxID=1448320 RepID=A0A319E174_9EURO|nr:hypothetical protein BO71DRAFT_399036 [Aspergillus ellipticus CBS 707.79]